MLSIGAMVPGQGRYYLELAREDYYFDGGEPAGRWWGRGSQDLGLGDIVGRSALERLFQGFSPDGHALIQNAGDEGHQPGWDLTFSAPKSVSVVWSQSDAKTRRAIQEAHFAAVKAALAYVEDEVTFSRRGKDGKDRSQAMLIAATFEHGTSRALDPHLHTHCLLLNVAVRPDSSTGTIVSKPIYLNKMATGALYRTELATRLQALGFECEPKRSWFEIKGVPSPLIDELSKRRAAILEELGPLGLETASAAAFATLKTREAKKVVPSRSELFTTWREIGLKHGYAPPKTRAPVPHADLASKARALVERAVENITQQESHFSKPDLIRRTAELGQAIGLSASHVRTAVSEAFSSPEFVHVGQLKNMPRYTTKEILSVEKGLLATAKELVEKQNVRVPKRLVNDVLSQFASPRSALVEEVKHHGRQFIRAAQGRKTRPIDREKIRQDAAFVLSPEQARAVRTITEPGDLALLSGVAGSGKTAALNACREIYEKSGFRVFGAAVSAKAARELQNRTGIRAGSLKRLELIMSNPTLGRKLRHHAKQLARAAVGKPTFRLKPLKIDKKTVLVIDEASMVGTRQLDLLFKAVKKGGGKLILAGDAGQLQPIEAGGPFSALLKRHEPAKLTEIRRQRDTADRKMVQDLAKGAAGTALKEIVERGLLSISKNRNQAIEQLVSDWAQDDASHPHRALIFCGTNKEVEILNELCQKQRLRSRQLDAEKCIRFGDGEFFVGDRVRMTENSRPIGVENGDLGTISRKGAVRNTITVVMDDGRTVVIPLSSYPHVRLGYAVTTHSGQGTTVENAYALVGGLMQHRQLSYTQASRAKGRTRYYTDEHEAGAKLANLARQMRESREKSLAIDLASQQQEADLEMER